MLRLAAAVAVGCAFGAAQSSSKAAAITFAPAYMPVESNSRVFFDIHINDQMTWFGSYSSRSIGKIEFELFDDTVPITARNFRELCTGGAGVSPEGKPLHFKGCVFHRIIPKFMIQGGDFTRGNGTGGCSIYGTRFRDESFSGKAGRHASPGLLSMANAGPHTNGSQFFITTVPCGWLDKKHVVFGQVLTGWDVVKEMEKHGSPNGKPDVSILIKECGVIRDAQTKSPVKSLSA